MVVIIRADCSSQGAGTCRGRFAPAAFPVCCLAYAKTDGRQHPAPGPAGTRGGAHKDEPPPIRETGPVSPAILVEVRAPITEPLPAIYGLFSPAILDEVENAV